MVLVIEKIMFINNLYLFISMAGSAKYDTINVLKETKERFATQFKQYKETDDVALNRLMDSKGTPKPEAIKAGQRNDQLSSLILLAAMALLTIFTQAELWIKGIVILALIIAGFFQIKKN